MLQSIRDNLTGPIVWVVIGLITVPFAIWGIDSFFTGGVDPTVAKVGDTKITQSQFRNAYDNSYRELQVRMGENFRADAIDQTLLRKNVLDLMVQQSVLRQSARSEGYRANDAVIREELLGAFQKDGRFSREDYERYLKIRGLTADRFEAQLRESMVIDQLRDTVLSSAFVTPVQAQVADRLSRQERQFRALTLDLARYLPKVSVGDEQVKQRYDERKDSYLAPERIKLAYVELALDQMPKSAVPAADLLKPVYEAEKASRFTTSEQRKASHILVAFGADKTAAEKKAKALHDRLVKSEDFAALAKTESADTVSAKDGGRLGVIARGTRNPAFEEALYGLSKAGEVSEPVSTPFGWELIRLDELVPARVAAFDDADTQRELLTLYQQREAQRHFEELSKKLEDISFENAGSLEATAKAVDGKVQTTDWFTRAGGSGIAATPAVITAAFSTEVVKDGENSKPIGTEPGHVVVVRKAEYEAPRQRDFAEVSGQIRDALRAEQASQMQQDEANAIVAELKSGKPADEVAKAHGLTFTTPAAVQRDASGQDRALLVELFRMARPAEGKTSVAQAQSKPGSISVLLLSAVKDAAAGDKTTTTSASSAQQRDATAGAEFAAYRGDLEKRVKVDIRNQALDEVKQQP